MVKGFGRKKKKEEPKKVEKKRAPNRLMVEESANDDNSVVVLNSAKLIELDMFMGDTVIIKGKRAKEHVCVAMKVEDESAPEPEPFKILMNRNVRKNLKVKLGDIVTVKPLPDVPSATRVQILPFEDSIEGIDGDLKEVFLVPYFQDCFRPVKKGDTFVIKKAMKNVEFKVVECEPGPYCTVTNDTMIYTDGKPINRDDEEKVDDIGYEDIGGC